jgi:hypothetical protein
MDEKGLYPSVPKKEGLDACKQALDNRPNPSIPTTDVLSNSAIFSVRWFIPLIINLNGAFSLCIFGLPFTEPWLTFRGSMYFLCHKEGLDACKQALDNRPNPSIPTTDVLSMIRLVLENNNFSFNGKHYLHDGN